MQNQPNPRATQTTFGTLAEEWFARQVNLRSSTRARYENDLRIHLMPRLRDTPIATLHENDVVRLIDEMLQGGSSAASVRNCLTPLRRICRLAVRRGLAPRNPVEMLERTEIPRTARRDQRLLDSEAIVRLLAAARSRYRTLLATAVFTGLRQGELLALLWEDIDFEHGFVKVHKGLDRHGHRVHPKTSSAIRDVVLMPALAELLATHRSASTFRDERDFVFPSVRGTPLSHRNVSQRGFDAAAAKAGLNRDGQRKANFHDLRHVFASLLIGQGANIAFVSRQLGHATPQVTLRTYGHLFDQYVHAERARTLLEAEFRPVLSSLLADTPAFAHHDACVTPRVAASENGSDCTKCPEGSTVSTG
jgi:integrase